MKNLVLIVVFLLISVVTTRADTQPWPIGGIGWSSDGQYIAVGTSAGVHIHASDDLSKQRVLDETFFVRMLAWSNSDLRIAYEDYDAQRVVIRDLATGDRSEVSAKGMIASFAWAPSDKSFAMLAYGGGGIKIYDAETQVVETAIRLTQFRGFGTPLVEWSPDGRYIVYGAIANGIAIFNAYTGNLVDFIWSQRNSSKVRWSPDGNLLAAGGSGLRIWQINQIYHPHDTVEEFAGDVVYERQGGSGLSWHPDSSRIAFVDTVYSNQDPLDFSGSRAVIWDLATGTDVELPGVFIWGVIGAYDVIEWSPDGSKLASISSDGRIVIWDAGTYDIVAEYAGYRSILDYYAENP